MSLVAHLLADAVDKGGPGSGPQGGKQSAKDASKTANSAYSGVRRAVAEGKTRADLANAAKLHMVASKAQEVAGNTNRATDHMNRAKDAMYLSQGHGYLNSNISITEQRIMGMGRGAGLKK